MTTLRKTGLVFVAKGGRQFLRETEAANRATERLEATIGRLSRLRVSFGDLRSKALADLVPRGALERLTPFSAGLGDLAGRLSFLSPQLGAASGALASFSSALGGVTGALSLTTVAVAAAGAALLALGMRGAAMPGIIRAFDVATHSAGVYSQTLLGELRAAARGTIPDLQLMKTANIALAGASEGLARAMGQGGLAGLLEIARAQARATGQDVGFLFDSLVSGVKRSSPMLIDNTGLVVKLGEAKQELAQQLGVSVEALSAEQQQIALLNATLAAGRMAVETYGQGALQASERLAIIQTTVTNLLDRMALAVQPVFNAFLAVAQALLEVVVWPIQHVVIPIFYELANALFGPLTEAFEGLARGVAQVFAPAAQTIHRWVVVVVGVLRGLGMAFRWVLGTIGKALQPVAGLLKKYIVEPVSAALDPTMFAKGAGYAFGALAQGILWAANTTIFPAVIAIAQFIADFLMGFSPPKRGPLATIDRGGANTMLAWLEGFTGVPLQPVKAVAAEVDAELGKIGRWSSAQVEARLAKLDAALQPFEDRLAIVKARVAAITEPLKGLQDALEKKLARALERFTKGDLGAEEVRALDRQRAALDKQLATAEDLTTEAEYQLALKRSQQAVERALLAIQARRTQGTEQQAVAAGKLAAATGRVADATEKAARGGEAELPAARGGALPELGGDPLGDFLGVSDEEITQMWGEMGAAASSAFADIAGDDLARAQENLATLRGELGRIKGSKPFQTLQDAVSTIFGTGEGSLWSKIQTFGDDVNNFFSSTLPGYFDGLPAKLQEKLVTPFAAAVTDVFSALMGTGRGVTVTLKNSVEQVSLSVVTWLKDLPTKLYDNLVTPYLDAVTDVWETLYGAGETALGTFVALLPAEVVTWLSDLGTKLYDNLVQPYLDTVSDVWQALLGEGPESLKTTLSGLPGKIGEWLVDLPARLAEYLQKPFENVISDILGRLGSIGDKIGEFLGLGGGSAPAPSGDGGFGARGGRARRGELWVVGERGWEFFRPDVPGRIIPHAQSVRLLNRMTPLPAASPARPVTNVTNSTSTMLTVNFNGGHDRQNLRMRLSEAKALL